MGNTLNQTLSDGGPDGRFTLQMTAEGTLGFGDLMQFGSPKGIDWIGQVHHVISGPATTLTPLITTLQTTKGTSTIRAFSIAQIGGALGDNGQTYKNVVYALRVAFGDVQMSGVDGSCGGAHMDRVMV